MASYNLTDWFEVFEGRETLEVEGDTVDGLEMPRSPPGMYKILQIMG